MAEGDAELQDLYRDVLVDYYRDPSHKGVLAGADLRAHGVNPLCGDEVELTGKRESGRFCGICFKGHGCVISQASTAMMCEALEGKSEAEARELVAAFKRMMLERAPTGELPDALSELEALEGVRKFPLRIKCALLGWNTLLQGLDDGAEYEEKA